MHILCVQFIKKKKKIKEIYKAFFTKNCVVIICLDVKVKLKVCIIKSSFVY